MKYSDTVIDGILEEYKDRRWEKREFDVQEYLDRYPQYTEEIQEAIEDYEFSLTAKGLDRVIETTKSADEIWNELLPRLREDC